MVKTPAAPVSSLVDRTVPVAAGAHVVGGAFLGGTAAFALADGTVLLSSGTDGPQRIAAHPDGAVLCATSAGGRLFTGGDDGRLVATDGAGVSDEITAGSGWVDAVAARADGTVVWSSGRTVNARDGKGKLAAWAAPSTVRGVSFMPKGYRVAVAHYGGVALWFPATAATPETLAWKGSHLDVTASPDGRFVVSSMQENTLHGWRLSDGRDMRMSGYPAKTRSMVWTADGAWLATSGAEACVVWPFANKDGPMGRAPKEVGVRPKRVTAVAAHPKSPVLAIGYLDGFVLLARLEDGAEILVRQADGGPISTLAWDARGERLLFGAEDGVAGLVSLP